MMLSILIVLLISSYKWTYNQIVSLTFDGNYFELEMITRNKKRIERVCKYNLNSVLKWQGGRPRILKLTLFDDNKKIADFYSGGSQKAEFALEEIAYKINKNKLPATNKQPN